MSSVAQFTVSAVSMISVMADVLVPSAQFRDVADLLRAACSSKFSASGAPLRWMILLDSFGHLPQFMITALRDVECNYEFRTIASLSEWDTTNELPYMDYKVIAIGLSMDDLRQVLDGYVSLLFSKARLT